jgi:hypothetical protein
LQDFFRCAAVINSVAINKGIIATQEYSGMVGDGEGGGGEGESVGTTTDSEGTLEGSAFTKNFTIFEGLSIQASPLSL